MAEKTSWDDEPWLIKRQKAYERLMSSVLLPFDRSSGVAWDLHNAVIAELDKLPYEEGGRQVHSPLGDVQP